MVKRRTRQLKSSAVESVVLAVEMFNRPATYARAAGVLLPLQHSLEMLFKAAIYEARGTIFPRGGAISFKFSECLSILRSNLNLLTDDQVLVAASIDAHRDAVQHHGSVLREQYLFVDAMSGLTLFRDTLLVAFHERLGDYPAFRGRTLPVAVDPPREFTAIVDSDMRYIAELLRPGHRRRAEALSLLRPYVLMERVTAVSEAVVQPTDDEMAAFVDRVRLEPEWTRLLPGIARLEFDSSSSMAYELRITKSKDAPPVRLVTTKEPAAAEAGAILEVEVLRQFPFNVTELGRHADVNQFESEAIVFASGFQSDPSLHRAVNIGSSSRPQVVHRYSHKALKAMREVVERGGLGEARSRYSAQRREARKMRARSGRPGNADHGAGASGNSEG
jgi:hypothetical protein